MLLYALRGDDSALDVYFCVASFLSDSACKPGSVVNGHLSLLCVTAKLQGASLVPPADIRRANNPHTVLLRIRFTANLRYRRSG